MELTRRKALMLGAGATALAFMPFTPATAAVEDAIAEFTGGADVSEGDITLTTPEIAENGNTVPISVDAPGAVSIAIFAAGNPSPDVVTFNFGPLAASHSASTRMRLAGTQDVIAIAKMSDGSFVRAANQVKVTIGGCGG
ncbi:thiosulfate oxidation carrier protein SoxY [Pararhizobium sp. IMCC21322]|uniref:thiosulfate oxidation carrier protein SoxY n=1 Tax=Pararhizobium sp. IMCC21322 TaxID=3067903 RepID=UPI002740E5C9|nr:thiosulfate oxidation carrier protein SoxY [Pararhizobium sp. IMCC21322]